MKVLTQILFLLFMFASCREDVIQPENTSGNKNEPFYLRTNFSYTFTINAEEITHQVTDNTNLNTLRSKIFMTIYDYSSGRVEIKIETTGNDLIYSNTLAGNTSGISDEIEGSEPNLITINFFDFTGMLKIVLTETD